MIHYYQDIESIKEVSLYGVLFTLKLKSNKYSLGSYVVNSHIDNAVHIRKHSQKHC